MKKLLAVVALIMVLVLLHKDEHTEGSKVLSGMMDVFDEAPEGSVYVMVLEDSLDYAGRGGLMSTAMKYRGLAGRLLTAAWAIRRDYEAAVSGVQPRHCAFGHGESFSADREERPRHLRVVPVRAADIREIPVHPRGRG